MAREFGVKSYKPENVGFAKSGADGTDDSPWSKLNRKIAKNILLEAYYNPSSIEELSLELGVAAPYMEEEVDILVNAELLKKLDNGKYETNFMILNAEAQREIENVHLKSIDEQLVTLKQLINTIFAEAEKDGRKLLGGYQTKDELKWLYLLRMVDNLGGGAYSKKYKDDKPHSYTKRPNGGYWDLVGFEEFSRCGDNFFLGLNGGSYGDATFWAYDFRQKEWGQRHHWYNDKEKTRVITEILDGKFDEARDKEIIDFLLDNGVFEKKDGKYIPKFAVITNKIDLISQSVSEEAKAKTTPVYEKLQELNIKLFDEIDAIIKKNIPERLEDKLWFYAETYMNLRGFIISAALKDGYIKIPENFSKSMVGAALFVTK